MNPTPRRIAFVYISTQSAFTFAASLIWAVNTLFLLRAGLNIFEVMVANSAFTMGMLVFEVPTGVVADTLGRQISFLAGIAIIIVSTVLYVLTAQMHWGLWLFVIASVLLGLGFTFQTGAVDAWLVDALDHVAYDKPKEEIFARAGIFSSLAVLVGTLVGGVLGQMDLTYPYYARAAILVVCFLLTAFLMKDLGFVPRPLRVSAFGAETRAIFAAGVTYGWRNPVVRPMLWVSLFGGIFWIYGFYSLPPFMLNVLLGKNLIFLFGVVMTAFSAASMLGNALMGRFMNARGGRRSPAGVLAAAAAITAAGVGAIGVVGLLTPASARGWVPFLIAAGIWVAIGVVFGITGPVRQGFINEHIPSAQRATVLSLDSFFSDAGGSGGSLALGYLTQMVNYGPAWVISAVPLALGYPLYRAAERAARSSAAPGRSEGDAAPTDDTDAGQGGQATG